MELEVLKELTKPFEENLMDYRLTGDLNCLLPIFTAATSLRGGMNVKGFKKALTQMERKAFIVLKERIGGQKGYISIVRAIEETKISRPVWVGLFRKIEDYSVGVVDNQGYKGTFVELFTDM